MTAAPKQVLFDIITREFGSDKWDKLAERQKKVGKTHKEVSVSGQMVEGTMKRLIDVSRRKNSAGKQETTINNRLIKQGPQFKMEYLGVMFAGMALQRATSGLIQTSKEWLGISELMNTTMGVVTLPAMMELLNLGVLPLSEALMNLSEGAKTGIGITILGLNVVGGLASVIGQGALGLYALETMFPESFAKAGGAGAVGGKILKATAGVSLGIIGLSILADGIKEGDFIKELQGAFMTGLGAAFMAASIGAGAGVAALIGTITVGVGLIVIGTIKSVRISKKIKDDPDYGFGDIIKEEGISGINPITLNALKKEGKLDTSKVKFRVFTPPELLSSIGELISGSFAVGTTNVPQNGLYQLHQGEQVLRKDQSNGGGTNVTIQYNITASSMKEFEDKLRESERRITSDIRRMSR